MCGRFTQTRSVESVAEHFAAQLAPGVAAGQRRRFNIAPTNDVLAVRNVEEGRQIRVLKWGLIPSWAKEPRIGARMINARGESVADKPAFRSSFKSKRCLIPIEGFYEWRKQGKARLPVLIRPAEGGLLALGGLWARWRNPEDESRIESCSIITVAANAQISAVHDRMPFMLHPDDWQAWLAGDPDDAKALLARAAAPPMALTRVTQHVNNVRNEDAECLTPLGEDEDA
jgi:putative SOS response-associated peptidase YedK